MDNDVRARRSNYIRWLYMDVISHACPNLNADLNQSLSESNRPMNGNKERQSDTWSACLLMLLRRIRRTSPQSDFSYWWNIILILNQCLGWVIILHGKNGFNYLCIPYSRRILVRKRTPKCFSHSTKIFARTGAKRHVDMVQRTLISLYQILNNSTSH